MTDYVQWQSDLSLDAVFAGSESLSYPTPLGLRGANDDFIYLTQLKDDNSRSVLMHCSLLGDGQYTKQCITPSPFNCRTKVNEYGGKPFWVFGSRVVFVNQSDQCLYEQDLSAKNATLPKRISPLAHQQQYMYTDVHQFDNNNYLAIVESCDLRDQQAENVCFLGLIDAKQADEPPVVLQSGADFYCNLVVNQRRNQAAWVEWQHPNMPWDDNQLMTAEFDVGAPQPLLKNIYRIDLGAPASVCQLLFAGNNDLYFSADFSDQNSSATRNTVLPIDSSLSEPDIEASANFWNIYCYKYPAQVLQQVTYLQAEFGYPHWQYGDHRLCQNSSDSLLAVASFAECDVLYKVSLSDHCVTRVAEQKGLQSLSSNYCLAANGSQEPANSTLAIEQHNDRQPSIVRITDVGIESIQIQGAQSQQYAGKISYAEHKSFVTRDQQAAYGFYYAPANEQYQNESPPPLLVMVHGGPTARAYGYFDLQKQFWTSRGFAIFDINHRGSSGYGRRFRDALYGQWGVVDANDIVDGVQALIEQGLADADQVCIRGKSAGGYAVLRALTEHPKTFCAGACYYGIGNLITLADTTHKFEKYYTDRLIGETYNAQAAVTNESAFYQRSPINKVDQIASAMIIFQGMQDNIVPPDVAKEMVAALEQAGLEHAYIEYQDEGHGFRQVSNNIDAWTKELAFYRQVLAKIG